MTQEIPALIAAARTWERSPGNQYSGVTLVSRLADALEAEHHRADEAEEVAMSMVDLRFHKHVEAERDRYRAALVEIRDYLNEGKGCWTPDLVDVLTVLDEAPNRPDGSRDD